MKDGIMMNVFCCKSIRQDYCSQTDWKKQMKWNINSLGKVMAVTMCQSHVCSGPHCCLKLIRQSDIQVATSCAFHLLTHKVAEILDSNFVTLLKQIQVLDLNGASVTKSFLFIFNLVLYYFSLS